MNINSKTGYFQNNVFIALYKIHLFSQIIITNNLIELLQNCDQQLNLKKNLISYIILQLCAN